MKLKAISVDDEPRAHTVIQHHASKIEQLELIESFTSSIKAAAYLNENQVDILFLDINMPDMNGIALLKTLKNPPHVIFTTAYEEYAVESYDFEAMGYLLKPIEFSKFFQAVMRVVEKMKTKPQSFHSSDQESKKVIFLKSGTKLLKIDTSKINYITASGNYAELRIGAEKLLVDHNLNELMEKLPPETFFRIHRSYSINSTYLEEYESHQLKISGQILPIGKTYRQAIKSLFSNF